MGGKNNEQDQSELVERRKIRNIRTRCREKVMVYQREW